MITEKHYVVGELAGHWGISSSRLRRLFEDEPGVLRLGEPSRRLGKKLKRRYFTLYIPQSVADRVHRRLEVKRTERSVDIW
jgi:AraC-like DNA-binding protein